MKKNISILLIVSCILIIFTLILFAEEIPLKPADEAEILLKKAEVVFDFRKTNWGMSKEQVKATEDKKPGGESDTCIAYEVEIDAKDFICLYQFLENKLFFSGYNYKEEHTNNNLYIDDYEDLKEILTKKYGEPMKDEEMWNTLSEWELKAYKQNPGNYIGVGFLTYFAFWETPTTRIELILDGDNYEINLRIRYISRELEEWADKIKEERAKSEF